MGIENGIHGIDMPELVMIQLGWSSFSYATCPENTVLTMKSRREKETSLVDMPKLKTLTTIDDDSYTFNCPRHITVESRGEMMA